MKTSVNNSLYRVGVKYGIVAGLLLILINVIPYVLNVYKKVGQWPQYIYYLFFIGIIFYSVKVFKSKNNGALKIKSALKMGITIAFVSASIFSLYNIVFQLFIDPDFAGQKIERTRVALQANPEMTKERLERLMVHANRSHNPVTGAAIFLVVNSLFGLFYAFITGLIMKNKVN